MVSTNTTIAPAAIQEPPIVAELQALFSRLDDSDLLKVLSRPGRRGPKGYDMSILWRCVITKHHLGLPSTAALIRTLHQNPFVAWACGIETPDRIPHKATFSRFYLKLSGRFALTELKNVSRSLVRRHYGELPAFGERVALDSTTLKGWVNGGTSKPSDPQAGWSVKKNSHGKTQYTLGYKLHLLVDCESEFPIAANVSAGNVNDFKRASNVLSEARYSHSRFKPRYTMADAGYSGKKLFNLIRRQYHSEPIIRLNASHRKLAEKYGEAQELPEWKALYSQRQAVERCFSRLKGLRSLNHITLQGKAKVTAHIYVALIAMQATHHL